MDGKVRKNMRNADRIRMEIREYQEKIQKYLEQEIKDDLKAGKDTSESIWMERALQHLKHLYSGVPGWWSGSRTFVWKDKDIRTVTGIWQKVNPQVQTLIPEIIRKYKTKMMVTEINALTAQALISSAMEEAGLHYYFIPQTHRAKVLVRINDRNKMVFYVSYKRIREELPGRVAAAKSMVSLMNSLGKGASVQKLMAYENW